MYSGEDKMWHMGYFISVATKWPWRYTVQSMAKVIKHVRHSTVYRLMNDVEHLAKIWEESIQKCTEWTPNPYSQSHPCWSWCTVHTSAKKSISKINVLQFPPKPEYCVGENLAWLLIDALAPCVARIRRWLGAFQINLSPGDFLFIYLH